MKKLMSGLAIAAIASTAFVGAASAQDTDTASGGNGGVSNANSNGGAVSIGTTNTGSGTGSTSVINSGEFLTGEDIAAMVIAAILAAE
jgi:ABC-type proline/glycine betaine transport system substrate-binding protein